MSKEILKILLPILLIWILVIGGIIFVIEKGRENLAEQNSSYSKELGKSIGGIISDFKEGVNN